MSGRRLEICFVVQVTDYEEELDPTTALREQ